MTPLASLVPDNFLRMNANPSNQKIQKLFVDAVTKLQKGDAGGARRGLEKVSRMLPDSAAVWYNLALTAQHLGQHAKAVREYRRSLGISPGQVDAHVNLGLSHKHLGELRAAMDASRKALFLEPSHPRALNLSGSLMAESGNLPGALDCFLKSIQSDPGNPDTVQNLESLAQALLEDGDPEKALGALYPLVERVDATREQQELQAHALLELRQYGMAGPLIQELSDRNPDEESIWFLEMLYREWNKEPFRAIEIAKRILERNFGDARVWDTLGRIHYDLNNITDARASHQKAVELEPNNPVYRNHLGLTYAAVGEREQAEENYREAIRLNASEVEPYRNLASMRKFDSPDDPDVRSMEALWKGDCLDDDARCRLAFSLGKVHDDCGDYDQAFRYYEIGNRLKMREISQSGFDIDQYLSHVNRIAETFLNPPGITAGVDYSRPRPIFILGMSRSGTTLIEQVISRHPDVTGRGELPCLEMAIARMERGHDEGRIYPDDFLHLDKGVLDEEAKAYLDWVDRLQTLKTSRFTDKMPFNFAHIWLIRSLFPDAAIIHCHRHPMDVILSNYFQWFGSDINYVYDLEILARFYVCYHRTMEHWDHIFSGELHRVQYEDFVADKERQTCSLIRGAGLEWDDVCLDSDHGRTAARTASIWQVRQGIYASSKERWRNYEQQLSSTMKILQEEGISVE